MSDLDALGQKLKGKAQQLQGQFSEERGNTIKGGLLKLKGKVNEAIADTKLKSKKNKAQAKDW